MNTAVPLTPRKQREEDVNLKIRTVIASLCHEWDLQLKLPQPSESPSTRLLNQTAAQKCVFRIKILTYRDAIDGVLADFNTQAKIKYSGWVHKPRGERGTVPEKTRHRTHPVSDEERLILQKLFSDIADEKFPPVLEQVRSAALSRQRIASPESLRRPAVDDSPIPNAFLSNAHSPSLKRAAEAAHDDSKTFKRPPNPTTNLEQGQLNFPSVTTTASDEGGNLSHAPSRVRSVATSFMSDIPTVFDQSRHRGSFSTQVTEPNDPDLDSSPSMEVTNGEQNHSSQYEGGSSFDAELVLVAESFNSKTDGNEDLYPVIVDDLRGLENYEAQVDPKKQRLRESLKGIFPEMPACLLSTPLHVRYEIVRIFLHTGAPLKGFLVPYKPQWDNYDSLWNFLKGLPVLKDCPFPERVSKQAWAACLDGFQHGLRGVSMTGSLRYRESNDRPLFKFQLEPLRLEQTYRLRRRFGNDRFLELDIPNLTGRRVPKVLRDCPDGKSIVIDWLFQDVHPLFGRFWVPFCTKPKEGREKERKVEGLEQSGIDGGVSHRLYFFAVHGAGFGDNAGTPKDSESVDSRTAMSVEALLDWIRPSWENRQQSYLKLFARTQLALSRNTPTVVLSRKQIRYKPDLTCNNIVMTDGAGRLSSALALEIVSMRGLSHLPSAFQGRIGDAKGLWSIDTSYHGEEKWIEIYDSQRKWTRSGETGDDHDYEDPAHRTFEINKWSGKLKPADLNEQLLPILMDRAKSKTRMRQDIETLLKNDLIERIESQKLAMQDPLTFRKWVRESNSRLPERVKHGSVPFKAAMPDAIEEKMNMLLDAGFEPLKLRYLNDLSQKYFTQKCEELKKRLHITVPRSTYAYMVPDFAGVLEPDEIYIHFSESFVDELSPLSGCPLNGMDVLVARSPAHFASDIQRVRAVVKEELLGLKDVIVFPTKGNPSLADKLSGGDYDGDLAWVCWERSIVENFVNAEVPKSPDLVKEGYILKDRTTYEELTKGELDPTTTFLHRSFGFNLENSMLGICTGFKENLCYTQKRINSKEAIYLSTLLSNLVDHAKQGYTFTEVQWDHFRRTLIKQTPQQPLYKSGSLDSKAQYIIDRLMYVADSTVEQMLTKFHTNMSKPEWWDPDLVEYSEWARKEARESPEWLRILQKLKADIGQVEAEWKRLHPNNINQGSKTDIEPFDSTLVRCYDLFQAIRPTGDTPLTRSLLEPWHAHPEASRWAHLRASQAFALYSRNYVSSFVWWMAGVQLCHLKAAKLGAMISTAPHMHAMLKPDSTFVKLRLSEQAMYQLEDAEADGAAGGKWR